jgi:hypothetical protein
MRRAERAIRGHVGVAFRAGGFAASLFRAGVQLGAQLLDLLRQPAPPFVQRDDLVNRRGGVQLGDLFLNVVGALAN